MLWSFSQALPSIWNVVPCIYFPNSYLFKSQCNHNFSRKSSLTPRLGIYQTIQEYLIFMYYLFFNVKVGLHQTVQQTMSGYSKRILHFRLFQKLLIFYL